MGKGTWAMLVLLLGPLTALWFVLFASSSVAAIVCGSSLLLASLLLAAPSTEGVTTGLIHLALKSVAIVPLFVVGLALLLLGAVSPFAAALTVIIALTFFGALLLGFVLVGGLYAKQVKAASKQHLTTIKGSVVNGGADGPSESLLERLIRIANSVDLGTLGGLHPSDGAQAAHPTPDEV